MNAQPETGIHLAIIPDGNRRWARERNLANWKGHEAAQDVLRAITDWCRNDPRIAVLTLWVFSTENWNRDPEEVRMLMNMLEKTLEEQRGTFAKEQTRFVHSGRKDRLSPRLRALIENVEQETAMHEEFTFNLALDYGGKDEVVRAVNRTGSLPVTDETVRAHLDNPDLPDIDCIIRTSGEMRTSNFFLWQSAYAEWIFAERYFPDMTTEDLASALDEYAARQRRFGG